MTDSIKVRGSSDGNYSPQDGKKIKPKEKQVDEIASPVIREDKRSAASSSKRRNAVKLDKSAIQEGLIKELVGGRNSGQELRDSNRSSTSSNRSSSSVASYESAESADSFQGEWIGDESSLDLLNQSAKDIGKPFTVSVFDGDRQAVGRNRRGNYCVPMYADKNAGSLLMSEFVDKKGVRHGGEVVQRTNTLSIFMKGNQQRINYLTSRKAELESKANPTFAEKQRLEEVSIELEECQRQQMVATHESQEGNTWASTNTYRDVLVNAGDQQTAKQTYIPLLANARNHTVVNGEGEQLRFTGRSGAVSDLRNGNTNIAELEDLQGRLASSNSISKSDQKLLKQAFGKDVDLTDISAVRKMVNKEVTTRRLALENLFLQGLVGDIDQMPADKKAAMLQKEGPIVSARISLLDAEKKPKREKSGFVLWEKNQMADINATYQRFDGKTLCFDGKGPYMDDAGIIHMATKQLDEAGNPLTKELKTVHMNFSGIEQNKGLQAEINAKGLEQMATLNQQGWSGSDLNAVDQLQGQLSKGESNFNMASSVINVLHKHADIVDVNCYGGKDRTSLVCGMGTSKEISHEVAKKLPPAEAKETMAGFNRQIVSKEGIGYGVVRDCTGLDALKLGPSVIQTTILSGNSLQERAKDTAKVAKNMVDIGNYIVKTMTGDEEAIKGQMGAGQVGQVTLAKIQQANKKNSEE